MAFEKIAFLASRAETAQSALKELSTQFNAYDIKEADVIIALGGDGFMLETLHATQFLKTPVYGMNRGTVGFLMNAYSKENLRERLQAAEAITISPLRMVAHTEDNREVVALAINEVALLRHGAQAAKLRISIDGKERLSELACDGALLSTPAGSTAYNYSAHGPILPVGSGVLALTAMSAFRPRRWRGAIVPDKSHVRFDVLEPQKRPVAVTADGRSSEIIRMVEITQAHDISHCLLFDPGHGLEERLVREQFV